MSVKEIQALIDEYYYWDMRVLRLNCNYFADEIELIYDDCEGSYVIYKFLGCYESHFDHVKTYDKLRPAKEMTIPQIPYSLQDVKVGEKTVEGIGFYTCNINMFPLEVEIWCKDIKITKEKS